MCLFQLHFKSTSDLRRGEPEQKVTIICLIVYFSLCFYVKKRRGVEFSSGEVQNDGKKLMSPRNPEGNLLLMHAYLEPLLDPRDNSRMVPLQDLGVDPSIHSFVFSLFTPKFCYSLVYHGKSINSTQFFCLSHLSKGSTYTLLFAAYKREIATSQKKNEERKCKKIPALGISPIKWRSHTFF